MATDQNKIAQDELHRRDSLLLKMYDQLWNDINTHILVVWQSIGVLIGAFAIFALAEKMIISIDVAVSLIILLSGWLLAHLYDASYWYNRNLAIVANIERQFLFRDDLTKVHYYFGKHRPNNKMITHLRIQYALGLGIAAMMLLFHIFSRLLPSIAEPRALTLSSLFQMSLPYVVLGAVVIYLMWLKRQRDQSYKEFLKNSPGIEIELDKSEVKYGIGHGYSEEEPQ